MDAKVPEASVDEKLRENFIEGMRNVAHSVTVVTTDGPAGRFGATVSAFSSVSADPPMVMVCLMDGSRISDAVYANKRFAVNVLAPDQRLVAERFAGAHDKQLTDRFDDIDFTDWGDGLPILDKTTAFHCNVDRVIKAATHNIILGAVVSTHAHDGEPMIYMDRKFRSMAELEAD